MSYCGKICNSWEVMHYEYVIFFKELYAEVRVPIIIYPQEK
jgi:hypothetical protein